MSRSRDISIILGATEASNTGNTSLATSDAAGGVDSAIVISIIDSDYVSSRSAAGGVDSASTLTLVGYEQNVFRVNSQTLTSNHTIDSADNAMSAGPITVDSGVTVTINGNWTVV